MVVAAFLALVVPANALVQWASNAMFGFRPSALWHHLAMGGPTGVVLFAAIVSIALLTSRGKAV